VMVGEDAEDALERHSGGEHRVPDLRSSFSGHAQATESELSFTNPMQQLDAGNRDRRMAEVLQSQHRPQTPFHTAVILLDDVVEILARADRNGPQLSILGPKLANGRWEAWYPSRVIRRLKA
jgi:hypothetical protein